MSYWVGHMHQHRQIAPPQSLKQLSKWIASNIWKQIISFSLKLRVTLNVIISLSLSRVYLDVCDIVYKCASFALNLVLQKCIYGFITCTVLWVWYCWWFLQAYTCFHFTLQSVLKWWIYDGAGSYFIMCPWNSVMEYLQTSRAWIRNGKDG